MVDSMPASIFEGISAVDGPQSYRDPVTGALYSRIIGSQGRWIYAPVIDGIPVEAASGMPLGRQDQFGGAASPRGNLAAGEGAVAAIYGNTAPGLPGYTESNYRMNGQVGDPGQTVIPTAQQQRNRYQDMQGGMHRGYGGGGGGYGGRRGGSGAGGRQVSLPGAAGAAQIEAGVAGQMGGLGGARQAALPGAAGAAQIAAGAAGGMGGGPRMWQPGAAGGAQIRAHTLNYDDNATLANFQGSFSGMPRAGGRPIDARMQDAQALGLRGVRRDSGGNITSGVGADGVRAEFNGPSSGQDWMDYVNGPNRSSYVPPEGAAPSRGRWPADPNTYTPPQGERGPTPQDIAGGGQIMRSNDLPPGYAYNDQGLIMGPDGRHAPEDTPMGQHNFSVWGNYQGEIEGPVQPGPSFSPNAGFAQPMQPGLQGLQNAQSDRPTSQGSQPWSPPVRGAAPLAPPPGEDPVIPTGVLPPLPATQTNGPRSIRDTPESNPFASGTRAAQRERQRDLNRRVEQPPSRTSGGSGSGRRQVHAYGNPNASTMVDARGDMRGRRP